MERLGDKQAARSGPEINDVLGTSTEGDDRLRLPGLEHVQKLVAPVLDGRGSRDRFGLRVDLPFRTTEERVDHDVGLVEAQLAEETLHTLAHAARCVACHGVRSQPVPVALVGECSIPVV